MSISSFIAVLIRAKEFKERTASKVFRASRMSSACFLRDDSDGIIETLIGAMDMEIRKTMSSLNNAASKYAKAIEVYLS